MSAMGDQMREEQPMAMSTAALVMLRISAVVWRVAAISGVATRRDVLVEVTTRQFQLTMKRMRYLCHVLSSGVLVSILSTGDSPSSLESSMADGSSMITMWQ